MSNAETITLLQLINHVLTKHPAIARTVEQMSQNVIYKRGELGASQYFGLDNLDQKLEKYLNYENGYYVELGANDGVSQSNTLYFEKNKNWRGILIEPTPHNYLLCLKNRSSKNEFFCNACVANTYDQKFVEILFSNLMSTPIGLETDVSDASQHAELGAQFLLPGERVFSFGALAATLNNIFTQANAPSKIDFLSVDVEGAEIEVLKGVDHRVYRFKYILVECRDIAKLEAYLSEHGYVLIDTLSAHDYLFEDQER